MKKRALVSVFDKNGIVEFCKQLQQLDYEIISTGGTLSTLIKEGVNAISISDITKFPECLDGRVKTLHPKIHAGLLARRDNREHMQKLDELNINTIDMLVVNLYPFAQTVAKKDVTFEDAVENIDIGGPTMLRSAAKNAMDVLVITDISDYPLVIEGLKNNSIDKKFRLNLMYKVFRHTAVYDTLIADYLQKQADIKFDESLSIAFKKVQDLRYGENPHQKGAFYKEINAPLDSLANLIKLQGKELSFLNIYDCDSAINIVKEFDEPAAVAIKHAIPCGVALADTPLNAYKKAYECDKISVFGAIVAINRQVDEDLANELVKTFLEVVIAPNFTKKALEILSSKPNLRVMELNGLDKKRQSDYDYKRVYGGLLLQENDQTLYDDLEVVTKNSPSENQLQQLIFALKVVKHVKSNAIVIAKDFAAIGISGGETNRIWAANQALNRAGENAIDSVAASDAFFPFSDCASSLINGGVRAIIQPGGSIRDNDSIELCNQHDIPMVFSKLRHFKH